MPKHNPHTSNTFQPLIFLDVGGKSFKMAKSTLWRYPDSLLAKMIDEFPDLVDKGIKLYVDRNPAVFPWIQEIHRDGDYKSCVPQLSKEVLQKELDFYQLPSLEELGLDSPECRFASKETASKSLMFHILREIDASGLKDMYPWDIYIYHKIVDNKLESDRKVCVRVPVELRNHVEYCTAGEHADFYATVRSSRSEGNLILQASTAPEVKFVVLPASSDFIKLLQPQADHYGLFVTKKGYRWSLINGETISFETLRITYQH